MTDRDYPGGYRKGKLMSLAPRLNHQKSGIAESTLHLLKFLCLTQNHLACRDDVR